MDKMRIALLCHVLKFDHAVFYEHFACPQHPAMTQKAVLNPGCADHIVFH